MRFMEDDGYYDFISPPVTIDTELRKIQICFASALLFFACSLGTALGPNLPAFFVFRALTAFQGTSFLIVGASCIGDIYRPVNLTLTVAFYPKVLLDRKSHSNGLVSFRHCHWTRRGVHCSFFISIQISH
jgi:hypothetical protein